MIEGKRDTSVAERFATNLRMLRAKIGMSQEELAFRAEVHRTQISLMEGARRLPRLDTIAKLAGALEVPVGDLTDGIAWTPSQHRPGGFLIGGDDDG